MQEQPANSSHNNSDCCETPEVPTKPKTLLGLHKVKRFFNLARRDGQLSSQDDRMRSGTDSDAAGSRYNLLQT